MSRLHHAACRSGLLLAAALAAFGARAATLHVTSAADSGVGSLREAIEMANATADDDEIVFAGDYTIVLDSALPPLLAAGGDLTITGRGADKTVIDGGNQHQIFFARNQNGLRFALKYLTVRRGNPAIRPGAGNTGGAIYFDGGSGKDLSVDGVRFQGNRAVNGGAAIYAEGAVTIQNSAFHDNTLSASVIVWNGPLFVADTTMVGDGASPALSLDGGSGTQAWLINTTVHANGSMRGVLVAGQMQVSLTNSLLTGASTVAASWGDLALSGSAGIDLAGSRNNLVGVQYRQSTAGALLTDGVNGNRIGVDPLLAPLGDYGGPTPTMALLPGSPALNAGTGDGDIDTTTDQRGVARVGAPDIGAFESRGFTLSRVSGQGQSANLGESFAAPLVVSVAALAANEPVAGGHVAFDAPVSGASATFTPAIVAAGGDVRTTATANDVAGSYTVTASLPGLPLQTAAFPLTNHLDPCVGIVFPYTVSGADNATRVANLRRAVECANANATADVIDLGGNTLSFDDGPYASGDGVMSALPTVTGILTLKNGELRRNDSAPEAFRFLYFAPSGAGDLLLVDGVAFHNGSATANQGNGGAIGSFNGTLEVRDSRFIKNHASTHGGAIYARTELRLRGNVFEGNTAAFDGGAVRGAAVDSRDTRFENNTAGTAGGGLMADRVVATGGWFKGNKAAVGGGSSIFQDAVVTGVSFIGNQATDNGGGANFGAGRSHIVNCRFEGNDAGPGGGGAMSASFGLGIQPRRIVNTLFRDNTTSGPGGIFWDASVVPVFVEFINVTASKNGQAGQPLFSTASNPIEIRNSILWGNPGALGAVTVTYSLVQGGFAGTGNIDGDPRFVDTAGGDYRLGDGSPAVDAGDNGVVPADEYDVDGDGDFAEPTPDLDGHPRLRDDAGVADTGVGVAPLVDMGAYERQADSVCGTPAFQFPYTLTGADNAARVANLRHAIACANANATADVIDLGGSTLMFHDAPYAGSSGDAALPLVTGGLTLKNGTLQRDAAAPAFRFLTIEPGQSHRVENVTFQGGRASSGGAILTRAALDVRDSLFADNGAANVGGAIHAQIGLRIRDTAFRRNEAEQGGAVYGDGDVEARASVFEDNVASGTGGGLSAHEVVAWNSRFLRNHAQGGGAIATVTGALSDLVVVRSQFVENRVPDGTGDVNGSGGAILYRGTAYVTGSQFTGNEAYSGGALQCLNVAAVMCRLEVGNSLFADNAAQGGSVHGSQVGDADSQVRFTNVTVADNGSIGLGSGIRLFHNYAGNVTVRNSIVWNNAVPIGEATVHRSLLDVPADPGNLFDLDPRFVDAANGDYRLGDGSPAVDAGDNGFALADSFDANENGDVDEDAPDLDNLPRRYDDAGVVDTGMGSTRIVDLGAYERQTDSSLPGITVTPAGGLVTTEAGGKATFTVVLDTQPSTDVTIPLSSSDATEGTVSPASLTFTASNWRAPQVVTITGVDDTDVDGDVAYSIVTAPAVSADANYDGLDAADVSVTNLDDDVAAGAHLVALKSVAQPGTTTRPVIYQIVLTNTGAGEQADDPASDELVDVLPPELALRGATADAGVVSVDASANTVRWNGRLAVGQSVILRIEADVAITQAATIVNQARINQDGDGDGHNDSSGVSTDPAAPGVDVPTAFRFDGVGPPVEPMPVPMDDPVALLGLLLLIVLGGGVVISQREYGSPAD